MFAPKVAKAQKKVAESSIGKRAAQRSNLAARAFGGAAVEQAHMLQRSIGNRATLRLLANGTSSRAENEPHGTPAIQFKPAPSTLTPVATVARPAWGLDEVKAIQKELIRLGLYTLTADGHLGRGTDVGLVEAFGGDEWRTLKSAECLTRLKAAKPPAAGKKGEHALRYGEMFKDGLIDMTLGLGFDEGDLGSAPANKAALDNLHDALGAQGFAQDASTAAVLFKGAGRAVNAKSLGEMWVKKNALSYTPPAGKPRSIHAVVRLVYSLDGKKGKEVASAYKEGLAQSDVAYYSGHGRYGSGPDFDRNYTFKLLAADGALEQAIDKYQQLELLLAAEGKKHGRTAWQQFEWRRDHKRIEVDATSGGNVVLNTENAHPGDFGSNLMYWSVNQKGGKGSPKVTGKGNELDKVQAAADEPDRNYRVVVFDGCRSVDYNTAIRATPGYDKKAADIFGSTKSLNWGDEGKTLAAFLDSILKMQSAEQIAKNMDDEQSVGPNAYHVYGAEDNPVAK